MAFLDKDDIKQVYQESKTEAHIWQEDYPTYERLMDNGLMPGMDENLPEVNDGSLSAALFKLPKRIVSRKLSGTAKAIDRDEAWMSELANLRWRNVIIPNANTQATFHRKLKDAVRKAAGYGSVPLITLEVERDGETFTDFIVAQPQDVRLEAGKVSDLDSDVIFWEVYYSKLQVQNMLEQAKAETKKADKDKDSYNKWDIEALTEILTSKKTEEKSTQDHSDSDKVPKLNGYKFCVVFQRGKDAPFYMYHSGTNTTVREWTNPDPTGDIPVHYLYCYQDFKNPYGVGIVKLAGGTQNALDYFRQADILATQIGISPPVAVEGNEEQVDMDSIVWQQNAVWFTGGAKVVRQEMANGVYQQLPERMAMLKTNLNALIPTGDTSIAANSGDPQYSKTPAGVKFQQASLSIDDEDFKDNLYATYEAVAKSMINTHFANMEGSDLMKTSDEERELLMKAGLQFPTTPDGEMSNQVELVWDEMRAKFNFTVDAEKDKETEDAMKLEGLTKVVELVTQATGQPILSGQPLILGKKQLDPGELISEIVSLTTDNDKIMTDYNPEEKVDENGNPVDPQQQSAQQTQEMGQQLQDAQAENEKLTQELAKAKQFAYKDAPEDVKRQMEQENGYQPSQLLSPVQEDLLIKQQAQDHAKAQAEHATNMDFVREASAPDPFKLAQAKSKPAVTKSKPKVKAKA